MASGFLPSAASTDVTYDIEGRIVGDRRGSPTHEQGVGDANSIYKTEAEQFQQMASFLLLNRRDDSHRRNYVVQPGGAILYRDRPRPLIDMPASNVQFGHEENPGAGQNATPGRHFTVGDDDR